MKAQQKLGFTEFVIALGFTNVRSAKTKHNPDQVRGFRYDEFDSNRVRRVLGKAKIHRPGMFLFKIDKTKAIRVDTVKNLLLLGNGRPAVESFVNSMTVHDDAIVRHKRGKKEKRRARIEKKNFPFPPK